MGIFPNVQVVVVDLFLTKSRTTPLCELRGLLLICFIKVRTPPLWCVLVAAGGLTVALRLSAGCCLCSSAVYAVLLLLLMYIFVRECVCVCSGPFRTCGTGVWDTSL